jgi:predicted GH43/DUF377 family glycosyl hydrolase
LEKAMEYCSIKHILFSLEALKQGLKDTRSILFSGKTKEFYQAAQGLFCDAKLRKELGIKMKNNALIGEDVELGKQVKVESKAVILGKTKILEGKIGRGAVLVDCVVKNIEVEPESLGVLIEQLNDKKVKIKRKQIASDVIILDEEKDQGIIKKIRVCSDIKKVKNIWERKLFAESDGSVKYSLKELFELSEFGISDFKISNLGSLSDGLQNRFYIYLGGSSKKFKETLLNQPMDAIFKEIKISKRVNKNPILSPREIIWKGVRWEKLVYNAAMVRINGITYFIYRAVGEDNISRFGFAWSKNGTQIDGRLPYPILWSDGKKIHPEAVKRPREKGGFEDPHLTLMEDKNRLYLLYTVAFATEQLICQQAMASISVENFIDLPNISENKIKQKWKKHGLISPLEERNAILFPEKINGKYAMIRRPMKGKVTNLKEYICQERFVGISFSKILKGQWPEEIKPLLSPRKDFWDSDRVGPCALLKTVYGWLLFYHAVGIRKGRKCYSIGCALLDIENPCKILYRCNEPVFIPEEDYELYGWLPNLVIAYGAVIKGKNSNEIAEKNDEIIVSYGGGDRVVGLFTVKLSDIIHPPKFLNKI